MTAEQPEADLIDFDDLVRTINGFDEIAISQVFRTRFAKLEDTAAARAVLFVHLRRAEKMSDPDAFRAVMNMGLGDLEARFKMDSGVQVSESEQAERDLEYGQFVAGLGMFLTPDEYRGLTLGERAALADAVQGRR